MQKILQLGIIGKITGNFVLGVLRSLLDLRPGLLRLPAAIAVLSVLAACSLLQAEEPAGAPTAIPVPVLADSEGRKLPYQVVEGHFSEWMEGAAFEYVFNAEELPVFQGVWEKGVIVFLQQGEAETIKTMILIAIDEPQYDPRHQENLTSVVLRTFVSAEALAWAAANTPPPEDEEISRNFSTPYGPTKLIYFFDSERSARVYTIEYGDGEGQGQ